MSKQKKATTTGSIGADGVPKMHYRDAFMEQIKSFGPCRVTWTCEKIYKQRSTKILHDDGTVTYGQNGYYHHIFLDDFATALSEAHGSYVSRKEAHILMCSKFWGKEMVLDTGEIIQLPGSSSDKSTAEYEDILQRARDWCWDYLHFKIRLPNEQGELPLDVQDGSPRPIELIVRSWRIDDKFSCPECHKPLGAPSYICDACNIKLKIKVKL